jgi:hypothetical protein
MLVDSSSSHSFVSTAVATALAGTSPLPHPLCVKVANCNVVLCTSQFEQMTWEVQRIQFKLDMKVIPL